ncbi:hypothetical protein [Enemella dayhoffiae]|uniref:hypothetical protein n=1 Tax=Enemella dayhoffiae TaxID=2016507 RepID=UPI00113FE254|nr:hypothetical protein [Enemella dayhoffiae]
MRPGRWTALLVGAVGAVLIGVGTLSAQAGPRAPKPVFGPPGHHADPGVVATDDGYRAYLTAGVRTRCPASRRAPRG